MQEKMRIIVYVDGLNLFYRCQKGADYYWLDIKKLCDEVISKEFLIPEYEIVKIKYFATPYKEKKNVPTSTAHIFNHYVEALQQKNSKIFEYIKGNFKQPKHADLPLERNFKAENGLHFKTVKVIKQEEKNTDVNIAIHIVNDAYQDEYDCAILITNDSDLKGALEMVNQYHENKRLGLICPAGRKKSPIKELTDQVYTSSETHKTYLSTLRRDDEKMQNSQLPESLKKFKLPKSWKK